MSAGVVYLLWRVFHNYFQRYAADNLPGPPASSLLYGAWVLGTHPALREV